MGRAGHLGLVGGGREAWGAEGVNLRGKRTGRGSWTFSPGRLSLGRGGGDGGQPEGASAALWPMLVPGRRPSTSERGRGPHSLRAV